MTTTLSRRHFLIGSAAGAGLLRAQSPDAGPRAIDLHHHFVSPGYVKALAAKEGHHMAGYTTWFALDRLKTYTPARDIEDMDREGVAASILSCTSPGVWFGKPEETRGLAREMNEFGAKAVSDHKGRMGLFAVLPLPTIEDSLREIEYAFDTLKADRVVVEAPINQSGADAGFKAHRRIAADRVRDGLPFWFGRETPHRPRKVRLHGRRTPRHSACERAPAVSDARIVRRSEYPRFR